ncbi:MAG: alanine:cation symporter family protein [Clostridia bacterium]|nr:alanine:cation symporter family protein [Clostridia bacterium]
MEEILKAVESVNSHINDLVWLKIGIFLLIGTGLFMTVITRFFQVAHISHWVKETIGSLFNKKSYSSSNGSVSQFQALCTTLAATIGVGNIAGVADAVVIGGPGAVFWMWVAAFFGMMTGYSENLLSVYFRRKNHDSEWSGGAMYYLKYGLGSIKCKSKLISSLFKKFGEILAILFALFCILASLGIGNMGQVDKIVANIEQALDIPALSSHVIYSSGGQSITLYSLSIGLVIMIAAGLIIIGGLKRIASFAEKIVPVIVILFISGSLVIILSKFDKIGDAFKAIFITAFNPSAIFGGACGYTISMVITSGIKRGVFSNEAGLGSSTIINSSSNVKEPVKQGMWNIFQIFIDTIIMCTITALTILTSGVYDLKAGAVAESGATGSTLVAAAFNRVLSVGNFDFGGIFVAVAILLFAFTTLIGWSHYGAKAFEFLFGTKYTVIYKIIFVATIALGAIMTSSIAWDISDTFNGLMMIPNLIGVILLSKTVIKVTKNYIDRKIKYKDIKPLLSYHADIQNELEAELYLEKQ